MDKVKWIHRWLNYNPRTLSWLRLLLNSAKWWFSYSKLAVADFIDTNMIKYLQNPICVLKNCWKTDGYEAPNYPDWLIKSIRKIREVTSLHRS